MSNCHLLFDALLLSISCQEVIFAHRYEESAEMMRDSHRAKNIINKLLSDTEVTGWIHFIECDVSKHIIEGMNIMDCDDVANIVKIRLFYIMASYLDPFHLI